MTMKHLDDFKLFESRQEMVSKIETLKEGDVIVATKDINFNEIDFKKMGKTWWGKNISNIYNLLKSEGLYLDNYKYEKGNVLFISSGGDIGYSFKIYSNGLELEFNNTTQPAKINELSSAIFGILLEYGQCEIRRYEEKSEFKDIFENKLRMLRVNDELSKGERVFISTPDKKIIGKRILGKITSKGDFSVMKDVNDVFTINVLVNNKKETFYYTKEEIDDIEFFDKNDGVITGNPFNFYK